MIPKPGNPTNIVADHLEAVWEVALKTPQDNDWSKVICPVA